MLVVMAGLPGTGKSLIASQLEQRLNAVVLDKDTLRVALFPPEDIEYSQAQDDFVMHTIYRTAEYLLKKDANRLVVIDGRPYASAYQVQEVRSFAARSGLELRLIECVCSNETARHRLGLDRMHHRHPAANRDAELYIALKSTAEPIPPPKLVVDTDRPLDLCLRECLEYIRSGEPAAVKDAPG
jgi:predicted kinase